MRKKDYIVIANGIRDTLEFFKTEQRKNPNDTLYSARQFAILYLVDNMVANLTATNTKFDAGKFRQYIFADY